MFRTVEGPAKGYHPKPFYINSLEVATLLTNGGIDKEETKMAPLSWTGSIITKLVPLIHHMGGSIRKEMSAKVTHLIANDVVGISISMQLLLGCLL
ncbi:hypothetical protein NQ318_014337 [Aromia moschata]|uniref:BRCT domain-containing protein n=1 Tax=Aromia moschata TaxID=1265417 RepID=A0AAV8YZ87_9CUCU|nr:hypothetical protein NQ318_014337 [Aromia moschata]